MKSIMEEASTIVKAIEKGWARAGKPQEFTVKIFEEPQKNIFGITTKPAKIALFFNEQVIPITATRKEPRRKPERPELKKEPLRKPVQKRELKRPAWSDDMVSAAESWVKNCLKLLGLPNIGYVTTVAGKNLKLQLDTSVTGDSTKERYLLRSFAHLITQSLRNQFKQEFRDLKVVILSE